MKLGAENRNKLIAAVALSVLAIILVVRFIPTVLGSSPAPEVRATASPIPVPAKKPQTSHASRFKTGQKKIAAAAEPSLDPLLRFDWLKASEDTTYSGSGRNIFKAEIEIPKPVVTHVKQGPVVPQGPPPPPPPPPINLKFFGFANKPGESKKVFLSQGEDIFIAGEGEIVDRRYKVLRITPTSVEIEDVLNNNRQMIPLVQG